MASPPIAGPPDQADSDAGSPLAVALPLSAAPAPARPLSPPAPPLPVPGASPVEPLGSSELPGGSFGGGSASAGSFDAPSAALSLWGWLLLVGWRRLWGSPLLCPSSLAFAPATPPG